MPILDIPRIRQNSIQLAILLLRPHKRRNWYSPNEISSHYKNISVNISISLLKLYPRHIERHLDLNVKVVLKEVFVVVRMVVRIDLLDGKVVRESIADVMMVVEKDHDSVVDSVGDVLLSRMACT